MVNVINSSAHLLITARKEENLVDAATSLNGKKPDARAHLPCCLNHEQI
jgi:hypothetical protein